MRRLLARTSLIGVVVGVLVAAVVSSAVVWWAVATHTSDIVARVTTDPASTMAIFVAVAAVASCRSGRASPRSTPCPRS
jgi:hypothetical protein